MNATGVFTYTKTWGYFDSATNRVTGMFGELLEKKADIGGTSSFMLPDRVARFEFVSMVVPTLASFIFRPPSLSNVANIYYLPFKGMVWVCSGLLVVIACFVIYLAVSRHHGDTTSRISDIALLGVGAICQMGSHVETKFLSTKISTVRKTSILNASLYITEQNFRYFSSSSYSSCTRRTRLTLCRCCSLPPRAFEHWSICCIRGSSWVSKTLRTIVGILRTRWNLCGVQYMKRKLRRLIKSQIS